MALHDGRELVEEATDGGALAVVERLGEAADVGGERQDVSQDLVARVRRDVDLEPAPVGGMRLAD